LPALPSGDFEHHLPPILPWFSFTPVSKDTTVKEAMPLDKASLLIKGTERLRLTRQIQMFYTHDLAVLEFDNLFTAMLVPSGTHSYPVKIAGSET
jgi:hypothetical protein